MYTIRVMRKKIKTKREAIMFVVFSKELQKDGGAEETVAVVKTQERAWVVVKTLIIDNVNSDLSYGYREL